MMRYDRRIVPSIFTMLNLFFGFFAIVNAVHGRFVLASWLIMLAALWDALDGKIARLTSTYSEFGIQFDSISDVVSFGAAPSILVYQILQVNHVLLNEHGVVGILGVIVSFFPLLFGAIRLARFNVNLDGFEKDNFTGLPIPAMAATVSAYVIFNYDLWEGLKFSPALIPLVLFLSYLMVSNVEYEALPQFTFRNGRRNSVALLLMLLGLAILSVLRQKAMFPLAFGFVLYGFLKWLLFHKDEEEEEAFDVSVSE